MSKKINSIKNLLYSSVGTYLEYFSGLLISILIARSISPEDYGSYSFLIWVSALAISIINNGITVSVIKFIAEERSKDRSGTLAFKVFRRMQFISAAVSIAVLLLIVYLYYDKFFFKYDTWVLGVIVLSVLFKSMYMFFMSVLKGMEKWSLISLTILLVSPLNLVLVALVSYFFPSYQNFIIVYFSVSLFYLISNLYWVNRNLENEENILSEQDEKRMYSQVKIVGINVVLGFLIYKQSEIAFLEYFGDSEDVAFFNVGFLLATSAIALVPGILSGLILPIMTRAGVNSLDDLGAKFLSSTRYLIFLTVPVIVVGSILSEQIILTLYGESYSESVPVLVVCLLSSGIATAVTASQSYFLSTDKQSVILKSFILVTPINLILDYILISNYGLPGAYWANFISSVILSLLLIGAARKRLKLKLEYFIYFKFVILGVLSAIPLALSVYYKLHYFLMFIFIIQFSVTYFFSSLVLKCWSEGDYTTFHNLLEKMKTKWGPSNAGR